MIFDAAPRATLHRAPLALLLALGTALAPVAASAQGAAAAPPARSATVTGPWTRPSAQAGRGWTRLRVAKWTLLGVASGFGVYALTHSSRADRDYGDLRTLCNEDPAGCTLDGGRYLEPRAESLYRGSLREDRRAQVGILGGQLTLLGSVALFVLDLRNVRGPGNIPYPAAGLERSPGPRRVAAGASVRF